MQSPKASWNAFVSRNEVSNRSGRITSRNACPASCETTSTLKAKRRSLPFLLEVRIEPELAAVVVRVAVRALHRSAP